MHPRLRRGVLFAAFIAAFAAGTPAAAQPAIHWIDWQSGYINWANGRFGLPSGPIDAAYTGNTPSPELFGTGVWNYPIYQNIPGYSVGQASQGDFVRLVWAGQQRIVFSSPVDNLFMAFVSVGRQPGFSPGAVTYDFDHAFDIVTEGAGAYGDGSLSHGADESILVGYEGHGVIRFRGPVSELNFSNGPSEDWHGFTLGITGPASGGTVTPEPVTLALLGTGLVGVAAARRRRREKPRH